MISETNVLGTMHVPRSKKMNIFHLKACQISTAEKRSIQCILDGGPKAGESRGANQNVYSSLCHSSVREERC